MYRSYHYLRPFAVFAGVIGVIQGLAWIGMAMTGIVAYYCHFNFENQTENLGSMLNFVFYRLYFQGNCVNAGFTDIDFTQLDGISTMRSMDVHAWMWVYLVISFFWFISSLTLLTNVTMDYIKYVNIFLYIWIFITVAISVLDLAFGILFALDYDTLAIVAQTQPIPPVTIHLLIVGYAQVAAGIMMTMAFRGWIVWLINVGLTLYFFRETFKIYDYNKMEGLSVGQSNPAFVNEPHSMLKTHPIDAFAFNHNHQNNFNNRWNVTNPQDVGRRERARSFSGPSVHDERVRPVQAADVAQAPQLRRFQPPPPNTREDDIVLRRDAAASSVAREIRNRQSLNENNNANRPIYMNNLNNMNHNDQQFPAPDYSPPTMRAYDNRPPLRSALRNSRYQ